MPNIFIYTKVCTVCNTEKPLCEFVMQNGRPQARCRDCNNKQAKEHFQKSILCTRQGSPWFNSYNIKITIRQSLIPFDDFIN